MRATPSNAASRGSVRNKSKPTRSALYRDVVFCLILLSAGGYFSFSALQGDYGLFRRIQIEDKEAQLRTQLAEISAEVTEMENKTRRMSAEFLDLELLDEQARRILVYVRHDDIFIK